MAKWFDTFCFMVLENHGWYSVQGCKFVDYFKTFGTVATDWHGVVHPSGPNYRAMLSGQTWSGNEFDRVRRDNVSRHVPYRVYNFRGVPADRHDPFYDMNDDVRTTTNGRYDAYAPITYFGLDDDHNAHSGSLETADQNVMEAIATLGKKLKDPRFLFMVVFDEGFGENYRDNHVFCGFLGGSVKKGIIVPYMNHYNLAHYLAANFEVALPLEAEPVQNKLEDYLNG